MAAAVFLIVAVEDFAAAGCAFGWVGVCTGAINMAADKIEIRTGIRIPFRAKRAFNEICANRTMVFVGFRQKKMPETTVNISDFGHKWIDWKAHTCVAKTCAKNCQIKDFNVGLMFF